MHKTPIRRSGNGLGVALPRTVIENIGLRGAGELYPIETDEGIILTPLNDRLFQWAMTYERMRKQYHRTLQRLAQ